MLDVHSPVRRVEVMRTPSGDHAERVVLVAQPTGTGVDVGTIRPALLRVHPLLGVVDLGRGSQPEVVFKFDGTGSGALSGPVG